MGSGSLPTAVNARFDQAERRLGITALADIDDNLALRRSREESLYFIINEALNNSFNHAGAKVEAIEMAGELSPDAILLVLVMPRKKGLEATREILKEDPGARILILTSFSDEDKIATVIKVGAVGYVLKDTSPDELVHAIRGAHMGKLSLPAHMLHLIMPKSLPDHEQKDT